MESYGSERERMKSVNALKRLEADVRKAKK